MLTLVFDGPHKLPTRGEMTRVVTLDECGREVGWYSIDSGNDDYGPQAEHPDREWLGWPSGIEMSCSFYNNVDENWACPSYDAAIHAALLEAAIRLDEEWYDNVMMGAPVNNQE